MKGFSVARFYSDSTLRQLGDIDMLVHLHELPLAKKVVTGKYNVDWHSETEIKFAFCSPAAAFCRSKLVPLLDSKVRVLCHEDNLHFVAIHMLKHAGWDPRWVTDTSVLLESRAAEFNWDVCLGPDPTRAGWVLTGLVIAHRLAAAEISGTPAENHKIPDWIIPAILNGRDDPNPGHVHPPESIWTALTHPWRLPRGLRKRWPNPLTAAIRTGASFEKRRRWDHQVRYCASLATNVFSRAI